MKKIIMAGICAGLVFFSGCNEKAKNQSSSNTSTDSENTSTAQNSESEKNAGEVIKKAELPKIVWYESDTIPFDEAELIDQQDTFSTFSTPLPVGDKIVISEDCTVYKTPECESFATSITNLPVSLESASKSGSIKEGSAVYLLYTGENRDSYYIVDKNGNAGWIKTSLPFKQRAYSESDSIIRKVWEKEGFDLAAFSPDGKIVAFHRWDYRYSSSEGISVCDRATGEELFTAEARPRSRIACAFSNDGKHFYYVADDKYLMQLSIADKTQKNLGSPTPHQAEINDGSEFIQSIHPLPDGENILCGVYYEPWAMYNLKTESWTYKKGGDFMWANSFAFSPDGKYIAGSAGNPTDICVWDKKTHKLIWQKYREFGGDLYYSADSKVLYAVNGTGITALNAKTGELISKANIEFPYHYNLYSWEVFPLKDRVVYTINTDNPGDYDSVHGFAYLYVYELSTGKLIQAEHIEDNGKKIESIAISPDGEYIAIRIKDDTHVNECHQVICAINLDKKAKEVPAVNYDTTDAVSREFLLENSFDCGWSRLSFYPDGVYGIWARHDGTQTGCWSITKADNNRSIVILSTPGYGDKKNEYSFQSKDEIKAFIPDYFYIRPDYEDFDSSGALEGHGDRYIYANKPSPAWKTYEYKGETVIKYPGWGATDIKYLHVLENTKMRKHPSMGADTVSIPYHDYKEDKHIDDRCILFAGQSLHIIAATAEKETIDGKTAPWYLVYEDDHTNEEYSTGELVWVFGGFSYESGER